MKQIQISYELFMDLCRYHLTGADDPELIGRINAGLCDKLERAAARETWSRRIADERRKSE